jgi:N-acetylmuramoyl-L-alanine amidase
MRLHPLFAFILVFLLAATGCTTQNPYIQNTPCRPCAPCPTPSCEKARPVTQPVAETRPKTTSAQKKPLIIIDPGHGGKDVGALTPTKPTYQEKNLNLANARLVEGFLKQQGFRTAMTRNDDTFLTLEERVELAKKRKAELFVSIHFNSAPNRKAEGVEVFYFESDKDKKRSAESKKLAQAVLNRIIAATGANSRGIKHGNFAVIRDSTTPAILIEGGFMTNEKEMDKLKDPAYMKKLAWATSQGIEDYANGK